MAKKTKAEEKTVPVIFVAVEHGHIEIVQLLISAGADVNAVAS